MIRPEWIVAARERIHTHICRTPLGYDDRRGIWIKWENQQVTGSFKARGAFNRVLAARPSELDAGLVCASAGNHGQAVALAARDLRESVDVFVGENADVFKVEKMRGLGAAIHVVPGGYAEAEAAGHAFASAANKTWISPYNDPLVIAGQGTVALEILEQLQVESPALWVVPLGGGGLIAGIGAALRHHHVPARLVGVQPAANAFMHALYHEGSQDGLKDLPSLADGLTGAVDADSITIDMVRNMVDDIMLVSEDEIARAIAWAWNVHHQSIEGSGAVGLAALLFGQLGGGPAVTVATGGNLDPARHASILRQYGQEPMS